LKDFLRTFGTIGSTEVNALQKAVGRFVLFLVIPDSGDIVGLRLK